MIGFIETPTSIIHSLILSIRVDNILLLHKLIVCYQPLLLPSDKLSHNYGTSTHFQWVNPLFPMVIFSSNLRSFRPTAARSKRCWRMRSPSPSLLRRDIAAVVVVVDDDDVYYYHHGILVIEYDSSLLSLYIYIHIHIYIIYIYTHTYIYIYMYTHIYIYIYIITYRDNRLYKQWWPWYWRFIYLFFCMYTYNI